MSEVLEPVTFSQKFEDSWVDLIVPEIFIRDIHFTTENHLMVMVRVMGGDAGKVRDFFADSEGEIFKVKTIEARHEWEINDEYILVSMYMDEGPPLSVDINSEQAMVRLILDFEVN